MSNEPKGPMADANAATLKGAPVINQGWLPIETAPRDGRRILLSDGKSVVIGGRLFACVGGVTANRFWHTQAGSGWSPSYKPKLTMWADLLPLPLVNPPTSGAGK